MGLLGGCLHFLSPRACATLTNVKLLHFYNSPIYLLNFFCEIPPPPTSSEAAALPPPYTPGKHRGLEMPFPIVFNIDNSSRHEVILITTDDSLEDLKKKIADIVPKSVNCEEFMAKYKKKDQQETVSSVKVKWSVAGRDKQTFPAETKLTDENVEAVLMLIESSGIGKDVLEVSLEASKGEK